jgi:hypothetical protein
LGEFGAMPPGKVLSELFAVERSAQHISLEREVSRDRAKLDRNA